MPYIKQEDRDAVVTNGLGELVMYLRTLPQETVKGFVAYAIMYLVKHVFKQNYYGKSTGADAVRSTFIELKKDLELYETMKRFENGEV